MTDVKFPSLQMQKRHFEWYPIVHQQIDELNDILPY